MTEARPALSRFQIVTEGSQAWCRGRDRLYYFDGLRFWVIKPGRRKPTVSWRTPSYGWVSARPDGCPTQVCGMESAETESAA
jgi:hypothetical protein